MVVAKLSSFINVHGKGRYHHPAPHSLWVVEAHKVCCWDALPHPVSSPGQLQLPEEQGLHKPACPCEPPRQVKGRQSYAALDFTVPKTQEMEWLPALSQSLYRSFHSFLLLWTPQLPSEQCSPEERMQVKLLLDTEILHVMCIWFNIHLDGIAPVWSELSILKPFSTLRLIHLSFVPAVAQVWPVLKDIHSLLEALGKALFVSFVCLFHKAMGINMIL